MTAQAPALRAIGPFDAALLRLIHAFCFAAEAWTQEAVSALLSGPGVGGLIATDARTEDPLGLVLWRHAAGEAEILTIGTVPPARRSGVGRALLGGTVDRLRAEGVGELFLEVAEDNAPARALYAALGFASVGRRRGYYQRPHGRGGKTGVDALVLRLALDAEPNPPIS